MSRRVLDGKCGRSSVLGESGTIQSRHPRLLASSVSGDSARTPDDILLPRNKIPLALGNAIEVLGCIAAVALVLASRHLENVLLMFVAYLLSWECLVFFPHCLAHFVTGRLPGVQFSHYFITSFPVAKMELPLISGVMSKLPLLGLKIQPKSLKSVSHDARAAMFASGATASMLLPFLSFPFSLFQLDVCLLF